LFSIINVFLGVEIGGGILGASWIFLFYIDALFDYEIRMTVWRKLCFAGFLQASAECQEANHLKEVDDLRISTSQIFLDIQRNI
jgi:hypothetical protein